MTAASASHRGPVDDDGFIDFAALRRYLARGGELPTVPAVRVKAVTHRGNVDAEDEEELHFRRTIEAAGGGGADKASQRYVGAVAFLTKRPGNPFPHMVTIGRARNADLRLALAAVSKVQAYFVTGDGAWSLVDQRSRNGTFVNGQRVEVGQRRPLSDGDTLQLGDALTLEYLLPESLRARAS